MGQTEEMDAFQQVRLAVSIGSGHQVDSGGRMNIEAVQIPEMMKGEPVDVHCIKGRIPGEAVAAGKLNLIQFSPWIFAPPSPVSTP